MSELKFKPLEHHGVWYNFGYKVDTVNQKIHMQGVNVQGEKTDISQIVDHEIMISVHAQLEAELLTHAS
jgi:hypothetical protein